MEPEDTHKRADIPGTQVQLIGDKVQRLEWNKVRLSFHLLFSLQRKAYTRISS